MTDIRMQVVMLSYETWRKRAPGRKEWNDLTIAEAEIAAGMWGMGVSDAAFTCDNYGQHWMGDKLRRLVDGKSSDGPGPTGYSPAVPAPHSD